MKFGIAGELAERYRGAVRCVTLAALFSSAQGALVISDQTLAAVIDPTGSLTVTRVASNSTGEAVLESLPGFGVIDSFGFSGNQSLSEDYIFNFSATTIPDFRIKYTGTISTSGAAVNIPSNTSFSTSGGTSMRLAGTTAGYGMEITLGDWSGTAFTGYSSTGVQALGFTLSGRYLQIDEVTVSFFDGLGNLLSSQTILGPETPSNSTDTSAGYFGYQITEAQNPIARVVISVDPSASYAGLFALDDLGFTPTIPEPSSALLAAGGMLLGFRRRRR